MEAVNKFKESSVSPDLNTGSGDFPCEFTSPNMVLSLPPKPTCLDTLPNKNDPFTPKDGDDPLTPKKGTFNPFVPRPYKSMPAPGCRKYLPKPKSSKSRIFNFVSSVKFEADETETKLDKKILETETSLAELSRKDPVPGDFLTPKSVPLLTHIAETAPGAPMKSTGEPRTIDLGVCKKLDFNIGL